MNKVLVFLALLFLAVTPLFAQGPVTGPYLVDHYSNNVGTTVTYHVSLAGVFATEFTFTEPQILTSTTTIPGSAITTILLPFAGCTITSAQLTNPSSTAFVISVSFSGCTNGLASETFPFPSGPATSAGVFSSGAAVPSTLTITISVSPDQQVRLVNFGAIGTPLTSPTGDVCANIYVFDANQELAACCSCRITPNGVKTLAVFRDLTPNPVTSVVPVNGDIKIVSTAATASTCTPLSYNGGLTDSLVGFGTHVSTTGIGAFITETQIPAAALSGQEQTFLTQACQFARYLGSGKGTCSCANVL